MLVLHDVLWGSFISFHVLNNQEMLGGQVLKEKLYWSIRKQLHTTWKVFLHSVHSCFGMNWKYLKFCFAFQYIHNINPYIMLANLCWDFPVWSWVIRAGIGSCFLASSILARTNKANDFEILTCDLCSSCLYLFSVIITAREEDAPTAEILMISPHIHPDYFLTVHKYFKRYFVSSNISFDCWH